MKSAILALFFTSYSSIFNGGFTSAHATEFAFEKDTTVPLVNVNIGFRVGTVHDPIGKSGMANFVGEMLMRGTQTRTKEQIDLELDQMGGALGVETRQEALIIRGAVLANQLDRFLKLVADIVSNPVFPDREIKKLKSEMISGILEERSSDAGVARKLFLDFMFAGHPYGKPTLGKTKDIEKLTRDQLRGFYTQYFNRKSLFVLAVGDTDESKIWSWTNQLVSKISDGSPPAIVADPKAPAQRRLRIVDKADRTQTQIYGGQIGITFNNPDFFPLYLGNYAFGGGSFSSRMMVEIRVKRGWSYGAYAGFRHGLKPRSWSFYLFPKVQDTQAALATTIKMVEDLRDQGITAEEFDFAKKSLISGVGFMFNTPKKRIENRIIEITMGLPEGFFKKYAVELDRLTRDQVNAALKKYIDPNHMALTVLGDAKTLKTPLAQAAGVAEKDIDIVPYTQE